MSKKFFLILSVFLCVTLFTFCQTNNAGKAEVKAGYSGMFFTGTDGNAFYVNFGGPNIKMNYKHWIVSVGMLPSLRFVEDKPRPFVTPTLGGGLMITYKKFIVGVPVYYIPSQLKWKLAPGIGIKIGK